MATVAAANTRISEGSVLSPLGSDVRMMTPAARTTNTPAAVIRDRTVGNAPGRISKNGIATDIAIMPMNRAFE